MQEDNQTPVQPQAPVNPEVQHSEQPMAEQPTTSPQPPTQEPPSAQSSEGQGKPKSNKILIIGVALLLLAVIGAAAYLFFQNQGNLSSQPTTYEECETAKGSVIQESYPATCVTKDGERFIQPISQDDQQRLIQETATPSVSPSDELTFEQDQMLDWKKYTSDAYSFMYPADVEFEEQEGGIATLIKWGPTQKADTEFFDGISLSFLSLSLSNSTITDYVQSQIDDIKNAGLAEVTSGPDPIKIGDYSGTTYTMTGLGTHKVIVLGSLDETKFVEITNSTIDPGNLGFSATVNQILDTFKFLE